MHRMYFDVKLNAYKVHQSTNTVIITLVHDIDMELHDNIKTGSLYNFDMLTQHMREYKILSFSIQDNMYDNFNIMSGGGYTTLYLNTNQFKVKI